MKVYVGYCPKDELAFRACVSSLRKHSSIPLDIIALRECDLRRKGIYRREYKVEANGQFVDLQDGRPFSTQFSFTRFSIPLIDKSDDWILFCDADFLWMDDVAKLTDFFDDNYSLMCVKHEYEPTDIIKMDGVSQGRYFRKNWSSLMAMRPAKINLTEYQLNTKPGVWLHSLKFAGNIGALPERWNWLHGHSSDDIEPGAVHYTMGTPDMLGDELKHSHEWWRAVYDWNASMNAPYI